MLTHQEECSRLADALRPLASQVRKKLPHWISTPNGDLGTEWCHDCGQSKVRNLRKRDPRRRDDYVLDGGWSTDADGSRVCAGCSVKLEYNLTKSGASEELDHYSVSLPTPGNIHEADDIREILIALEYIDEDNAGHVEMVKEAIVHANLILSSPTEKPE